MPTFYDEMNHLFEEKSKRRDFSKTSYKDTGTQTEANKCISSGEDYDDSSSSNSHKNSNQNLNDSLSTRQHNNLILKHQLTRDSGIDSDTNVHQKRTHSKPRVSNVSEEMPLLKDTNRSSDAASRQLSVLKTHVIKTSFSSTRDNSVDHDFRGISSHSLDDSDNLNSHSNSSSNEIINSERDDIMIGLFSRNVAEDDENALNVEEDKYKHDKKLTSPSGSFDMAASRRMLFKSN